MTIHVQATALVKDPRDVLNVPKVMSRVMKKDVKVLPCLMSSFTMQFRATLEYIQCIHSVVENVLWQG